MDKIKKPTIHDVAKLANVSTATISRVINDSPKVSKKTRDKVNAAINELNFVPNILAQSLVSSRSKNIGIILPKKELTVFELIALRGIFDASNTYDVNIIVINSFNLTPKKMHELDFFNFLGIISFETEKQDIIDNEKTIYINSEDETLNTISNNWDKFSNFVEGKKCYKLVKDIFHLEGLEVEIVNQFELIKDNGVLIVSNAQLLEKVVKNALDFKKRNITVLNLVQSFNLTFDNFINVDLYLYALGANAISQIKKQKIEKKSFVSVSLEGVN